MKRIAVVDVSVFIGSTPPHTHTHVLGVASQEHQLVALLLFCSLLVCQVMIFISLTTNPACQQVPRYLSQQWEKATDKGEVGTISITK